MSIATETSSGMPALWFEPAPRHFDSAIPWWLKAGLVAVVVVVSILFLDARIAVWAHALPFPDLARAATAAPAPKGYGDAGRELMFLEQFGQFTCTAVAVVGVCLLDPAGRRRALAIMMACVITLVLTHLFKDLFGRTRPFVAADSADGHWLWGGPARGFSAGMRWTSFPSAHTSAAFALASALAWFYPRGRALFMSLAIITATLRVLHTAHYLSDVFAGMALGVAATRLTLACALPGRIIALLPPPARHWWLS